MTRLLDDAAEFSEDMLEGFVELYSDRVAAVPGGVVRADVPERSKVAVIVGGGSGHYPAFCGVVGPGFADGAVVGNIFTSPSTESVLSVARAANSGAGVLLTYGNYAGDRMNFGLAEEQLRSEGIDTRTALVTDDIASAPSSESDRRRGIAGDFAIFKIAGAAAEAGYSLDDVERVARHANDRTRTLGVAFAGCTIPGSSEPLFRVASGKMDVGLGIHGEPGISEEPLPTATQLAERFVSAVLSEAPADAGRVAVILNGLGRTKYEELFVVWRSVARLLAARGLTIVEPEVGELVTSLDMEGCSLTVLFLDDELESLWRAPADTPSYRKGSILIAGDNVGAATHHSRRTAPVGAEHTHETAAASTAASRRSAQSIVLGLRAVSEAIHANEEELGSLDAVAGDGDHGRGMVRGVDAALQAASDDVARGAGAGSTLSAAGREWAARAGGTSGVLWGSALQAAGTVLGDTDAPTGETIGRALAAALASMQKLGGAKRGDKTMLDALGPFVDRYESGIGSGQSFPAAWSAAAKTATSAADGTRDLRPLVGRARPLAERSLGTPDPGAVSLALAVSTVGRLLESAAESAR